MNDPFKKAKANLRDLSVLDALLKGMERKQSNDPCYIPKNIELVEELIIVFTNLKNDLLLLLQDDHEDNMDFKN